MRCANHEATRPRHIDYERLRRRSSIDEARGWRRVWESGGPVSMPDLAGDTSLRAPAAVAAAFMHACFPVRSGRAL